MPEPISTEIPNNASTGSYIMNKYRVLGKKGEGTFSEVLKCQSIKDGTYWACKKMKQQYDSVEQVNHLREIQALRRLSPHTNILELHEVMFDKKSGTLVLICELMEMNIYELIRDRQKYLHEDKIKNYMYQLCKSIDHMHRNGIFHRDVKPENILIKDDVLKLADFGSCRSVYSKQPYTEYISTRWYRAPECLLTDGYYTYKMDMWSVGCVFFEILSLHPLFPGSNEVDQIAKIHDVIGTPDPSVINKLRNKTRGMNFNFPPKRGTGINKLLSHSSESCIELINLMCAYDPDERLSAKQALKHSYFKDLRDADKKAAKLKPPEIAPETDGEDSKSVRSTKSMLAKKHKDSKDKDNKDLKDENQQTQNELNKDPKEKRNKVKEKQKTNEIATTVAKGSDKTETNDKVSDSPRQVKEDALIQLKKKSSTSPVRSLRPGSGGLPRYPGSILHNKDPLYNYHRREKRRQRRKMRMTEPSPVSQSIDGILPKMPQPQAAKNMGYQPTFHFATGTLPKIANAANATTTTSYLPSLGQAFVKPAKQKQVAANGAAPQATKNLFGHYQLPSIDRRGGGP